MKICLRELVAYGIIPMSDYRNEGDERLITSIIFPSRYYQGKDALLEFGPRAEQWGKSFLFVGTKTALSIARPKLEKSFENLECTVNYELSSGKPVEEEYARVKKLAEQYGPDMVVGVGGGAVIDIARSAGMMNGKLVGCIPTSVAADAPCTNVSVHYSQDGLLALGADIFHKGPDLVFVDVTIIAEAPARYLVSGIGDALATYYEAMTCRNNNIPQFGEVYSTYTAIELSRICRDMILEYGLAAKLACENRAVTPALENCVEAAALLSGVGGLNSGCSGGHGIGDYLGTLPGGHDSLHGERVSVGLVAQLIMEDYPMDEIEGVIEFCKSVGLPTCIKDMGISDIDEAAVKIGEAVTNERFITHMANVDHSPAAIAGAIKTAVALSEGC